FLARPFVSFVSHIARYAPSSTDKSTSLRNQNQFNLIFRTPLKDEADCMHLYREKVLSFLQSTKKIFHTQRPFSVLTLLAFGDEKYYI
ncbi:hypothetical protein, partial [Prevotellamassilia timonensis]|uniref:hypothetical protein n=1 Tax=Prevotellamassilia timonensis TaxID=1852370 RepID=UPI001F2A767A